MRSALIQEEWRPVSEYIGLYEVSNSGRVRSMWYGKVRILKLQKVKGELRVTLGKDGKNKRFFVHRLVWEAFNGTIPEGMQVNHIDERPWNNAVWNLNLMTPKENQNYGCCIRRRSEKRSQAVLQLTYPGLEFMCEWSSTAEAGRNGFEFRHVSDCCLGRRKSHKGVTFRYKETYSL